MAEPNTAETQFPRLRVLDPRTLKPNPNNPRKTPVAPADDALLLASIKTRGIIQPPIVAEKDGELFIRVGHRRTKFAIKLDLNPIIVIETEPGNIDPMDSLAENLVRAAMNPVDTWRAIDNLEKQNPQWNEQAVADSLALPVRTVRRLKLLANIHTPILDVMARGDMPSEEQLRIIAATTQEEQAQVWKKHKPKKSEPTQWHAVANGLSKRRIPFSAAKFDDALAEKYGVVWLDDLFAPADEDGRYTTEVEGFFGAQQEWLQNNLPERGALLPQNEYGQPVLPRKAEHVHGKPGKHDTIGHYLDPRTAEVRTITYRMPSEKKVSVKAGKETTPEVSGEPVRKRPDVTQKGNAIIGDLRTDALHEALRQNDIADTTLVALLVLALAGRNVSVQSGINESRMDREDIAVALAEGGVLTADHDAIRKAARDMLAVVLSCRDNMFDSGVTARIAGDTIGASVLIPNMATDEFLSCLSRQALEREAGANGVRVEVRVKDTRAGMVQHFASTTWHYPGAVFALTKEEIGGGLTPGGHYVPGLGRHDSEDDELDGDLPPEPPASLDDSDADGGEPRTYSEAAD